MRQIILDTETTGLSPEEGHRIIEIGCVEMVNRQLTGNHFHEYIKPEREVEAGALQVHGISNEFLEDKPLFHEIADAFIDYVKDAEIIIHNAPFDVGFINAEFKRLGASYRAIETYCEITDTLQMARSRHPGQRNNLDALCKRYAIDNSKRDLHGALLDSEILAEVYLAMTVGQGRLALDPTAANTNQITKGASSSSANTAEEVKWNIKKQLATEAEEQAHKERMAKIAEVSGKSLWPE